MKTGIELIAEERQEQIEKHGFSLQHDIEEFGVEDPPLPNAAVYCITGDNNYWPSQWEQYWRDRIDKKSRINRLTVAGALIAAEIDRLQSKFKP